jgi:GGDEF domain-containing protein
MASGRVLVVAHGRSVGCRFALRRRPATLGGGAGDDVRLEGLAPCVARLDHGPTGWSVTRLADRLDVAIDGRETARAPLPDGAELWVDGAILWLVDGTSEAYADVLFRLSTLDAVTGLANGRWLQELVARDRVRAERAAVPVSLACFRLVGLEEVRERHGTLASHRLLRSVGGLLRSELGDRPLGRMRDATLAVLLEGNLDARYPFVDRLRRAIGELEIETRRGPMRVRAVAAIADLPATAAIDPLVSRMGERLDRTTNGVVPID